MPTSPLHGNWRRGEGIVNGLRELLSEDAFRLFRKDVPLEFLRDFPSAPPTQLEEVLRSALALPAAHPELLALARNVIAGATIVDTPQCNLWLAAAYFASPQEFATQVESEAQVRPELVWPLRDLSGYERHGDQDQPLALALTQLEFLARVIGGLFPEVGYPSGGWGGDTNPWDAAEFVRYLINAISTMPSEAATEALVRLESNDRLSSYRERIRHVLASQRTRRREAEYDRPNWRQTVQALANGPPANVADLHALVVAHLADVRQRIAAANTDIYKSFWNEDSHGN